MNYKTTVLRSMQRVADALDDIGLMDEADTITQLMPSIAGQTKKAIPAFIDEISTNSTQYQAGTPAYTTIIQSAGYNPDEFSAVIVDNDSKTYFGRHTDGTLVRFN